MSVYGKIKEYKIVTLQDELADLTPDDKGCESYIITKHETAEKHGRYVVRLKVEDPRWPKDLSTLSLFLPKGLIDNNLLEKDIFIECGDSSCNLKIVGVNDWFDRAYNGATQIHDIKSKQPYTT